MKQVLTDFLSRSKWAFWMLAVSLGRKLVDAKLPDAKLPYICTSVYYQFMAVLAIATVTAGIISFWSLKEKVGKEGYNEASTWPFVLLSVLLAFWIGIWNKCGG